MPQARAPQQLLTGPARARPCRTRPSSAASCHIPVHGDRDVNRRSGAALQRVAAGVLTETDMVPGLRGIERGCCFRPSGCQSSPARSIMLRGGRQRSSLAGSVRSGGGRLRQSDRATDRRAGSAAGGALDVSAGV